MKKLLAGVLTLGLVMSMGSTTIYAHGHGHGGHGCSTKSTVCNYCSAGCSFIDRDHDGICDNCDYAVCQKTGTHKHKNGHRSCKW